MALLPYSQIGDNLYSDQAGKYFNINNGYRSYVQSPYDTQSSKINSLYDSQKKNQLDLLKQQREKAIGGFNQQKKDLAPGYQNQRNQADVVNAQNVSRLRELMAANGINASGENLTTQANVASSRQNALSEIDNNEQYAIREIDQQIANENDPGRDQAIINAIEAERSGKLADAWSQSQAQQYQQMVDWRNYQMEKQQFDWEMEQRRKAAAGGSGGGGGGSRGGSKKKSTTTKTVQANDPYEEYKKQLALSRKYDPAPFQPAQTKPRPIF